MRLRVTLLRLSGRPLERRAALAATSVVGELLVHYANDGRGRPVKRALLVDASHALRRELITPLHGPELLAAAQLGLVLRGTELDRGGREYVQEWWCRPPEG